MRHDTVSNVPAIGLLCKYQIPAKDLPMLEGLMKYYLLLRANLIYFVMHNLFTIA